MKSLATILILLAICLTGCANRQENEKNDYTVSKTSYTNIENNNTNVIEEKKKKPIETDLASFSTKIMYKDTNRQHNMALTCSKLNGTIVKSGETFSFCNTVGKATKEKGYQEADVYVDGEKKQGLGGGNCQVSTTLYNAVLKVDGLEIIERHEHSGDVFYVPEGMDACVAYGSCDFKFKNENTFDVKLYFSNTPDSIDVSIVKISS